MKKLLIIMLVLGMASLANAGITLSVDGNPNPGEIDLLVSETFILDIDVSGLPHDAFGGGDILVKLSNAQGSLDATNAYVINPVQTEYWVTVPNIYTGWTEGQVDWDVSGVTQVDPQNVIVSALNQQWNTKPDYRLMDGLLFHCDDPTDVIITLEAYSPLVYYTHDATGGVLEQLIEYEEGTILDTLTVHQIPEPATLLLLGLGGLFLRRKK